MHTQTPAAFMDDRNASIAVGQEARATALANAEEAAGVLEHLFPLWMTTERTADGRLKL